MTTTKIKGSAKFAVMILGFMAFVFTAVGGTFSYFSYDFSQHAVAATGTVVSIESSYSDGSTTYKPTIAYIDVGGNKRTGQTFLSSSSYNFQLGAQVEILHDYRDPQNLRINSWFALWGFGLIFLIVGLVLLGIAMIVARSSKRAKGIRRPSSKSAPKKTYSYSSSSSAQRAGRIESKEDHKRETDYKPTVRRQ